MSMRDEDLAPFAIADGLLAKIATDPGRMSQAEQDYLLFQAARTLVRVSGLTGEEAFRMLHPFTAENRTTIQCNREFACVSAWGRLLYVINRHDLAGLVHPERN